MPRPIRLWPGVAIVVLQWIVFLLVPMVVPDAGGLAMAGGVVGGLLALLWWMFFSRAPWLDRIGVVLAMVAAVAVTSLFVHMSISNGMMGFMLPIYSLPGLSLALVLAVAGGRTLAPFQKRALAAAAIVLACVPMTMIRTGGIDGDGGADLHWRWTASPEERLLAAGPDPATVQPTIAALPSTPALETTAAAATSGGTPDAGDSSAAPAPASVPIAWPGFRGPARDGVVRGVRIETDWTRTPPQEVWRRAIGPGWSSFAVSGDTLYTQEQRGDDEVVSAYRVSTGAPVWTHRDRVRFWESNAGAGPRATPSLAHGRVYSLGGTGVLNALDAATGRVVWSRNAATQTAVEVPEWGVAGSPLVVGDAVVVAVSGRLAAYDAATGELKWMGPAGGAGYSSPHLVTFDGEPQIMLLRGSRTISVSPADGAVLWQHTWLQGSGIVQPVVASASDVLLPTSDGMGGAGIRRLAVTHQPGSWTVEERWTSRGLKPYFNDIVVHQGHAYGFDGGILAAINLSDGERAWKGGRYGHGQLILLAEQNLLLVLSEEGDLALVEAKPDAFSEVGKFKAIDGKTWNHPVLVGDVVLVRNGEEMAAFRLRVSARP